ncbi:sensor histidine kinase [Lentzea sp. BCCO 10_0798]|uniref:histidine kinase n=1 Tax=Lentzea kristufekii TaxID=3095430 RepID=A0ABU4TVR0_9PSEU|nr:sensor histidine kinase [Lentzea sp. BCCO 10_0798]MDX8052398.1 sensor histidine kinase [Lentzea sp. BCCO 10_0798]
MDDRRVSGPTSHPAGPRSWWSFPRRMRALPERLRGTIGGDAVLAGAAVVVVSVLGLVEHRSASPVVMVAASVAVAVPLLLRRRFPLITAFASAAIVIVIAVPDRSGRLVAMAAFGSAAYYRPRPAVFVVAVGWLLVLSVAGVRSPTAATWTDLLLLGLAPVAVGYALRMHRDRADDAERLYREETRGVIAEEHARMAREVHDAVGHHLTVIRMQANAVRHVVRSLPPVADRALVTIAEVSATALTEVRDVLAALPTRGTTLTDLDALVNHVTGPNRTVTLTRDGPVSGGLPPLVDHAGYRLAQEALTNALRHSDATRVDLHLHHTPDAVVITVADNGSTTPGPTAEGTGLRGIRERTRLLGGTLRIEPNRPSGWLVEARLPLGEER